jgi:hypothetical protein
MKVTYLKVNSVKCMKSMDLLDLTEQICIYACVPWNMKGGLHFLHKQQGKVA